MAQGSITWNQAIGGDSAPKLGRIIPLMKTAQTLVHYCLQLKPGQSVLIVTDYDASPYIPYVVAGAVEQAGGIPTIVTIPPVSHLGAEVPRPVQAAFQETDFIVNLCSRTITHAKSRLEAAKKGVGLLACPAPSEDSFTRGAATVDFEKVKEISLKLTDQLNRNGGGKTIHIASDFGTDVTMDVTGRPFKSSHGQLGGDVKATSFPGGEVNTMPVEDSNEGVIVFDTWMHEVGSLDQPIRVTLEAGRVTRIEGGREAEALSKLLAEKGTDASYHIGELALGTNHGARIVGSAYEDKESYGCIHIAIGTGLIYDPYYRPKYVGPLHLDGMILKPTLTLDGETIIDHGEIVVAPRPGA